MSFRHRNLKLTPNTTHTCMYDDEQRSYKKKMQTKTESGPSPYFSVFIPQFTQSTHARDLLLLSFYLTINVINNGGNASRPSQPSSLATHATDSGPVRGGRGR